LASPHARKTDVRCGRSNIAALRWILTTKG